jgi:predicted 3-demethylubiquinone-9 3-methyltransferase (glyoxalase superfamily)
MRPGRPSPPEPGCSTTGTGAGDGARARLRLRTARTTCPEQPVVRRRTPFRLPPGGPARSATGELDALQVILFDGGPLHTPTPASSLSVPVDSQEQIDRLWGDLTADGGRPDRCGWLQDPFGVSWHFVPSVPALLADPDPGRAARALQAMLGMGRLDIAELQHTADGA